MRRRAHDATRVTARSKDRGPSLIRRGRGPADRLVARARQEHIFERRLERRHRHECPPPAAIAATNGSGRLPGPSSNVMTPVGDDALGGELPRDAVGRQRLHVGHDDFPPVFWRVVSSSTASADDSRPLARMPRGAQRLGIRQDVRAEEHRPPLVAKLQDQIAHLAPADGIEPGHRLVEDDELRIVDERLREADALHHAFRVLADRPAAIGAKTRRDRGPPRHGAAVRRRGSRTGPRSTSAAPRRTGGRRTSDSPAGSRAAGGRSRSPAGRPRSSARPDVGRSRSISSLSVVLLPAPFGPSRPKTPPAGISSDSVRQRAMRARPPEARREILVRWSVRTTVMWLRHRYRGRQDPLRVAIARPDSAPA